MAAAQPAGQQEEVKRADDSSQAAPADLAALNSEAVAPIVDSNNASSLENAVAAPVVAPEAAEEDKKE